MNPSTGQLIKDTLLNKLSSLYHRYSTNYADTYYYHFENRLLSVLRHIDLEDLGQQLELIKLESKRISSDTHWSDIYKGRVVHFIMQYDLSVYEELLDISYFKSNEDDIRTNIICMDISRFQRKLLFSLLDGYTVEEVSKLYGVSRLTIYRWLDSIVEYLG